MKLATRGIGVLALAALLSTCAGESDRGNGTCRAYCADLCQAMSDCDFGDIPPSCASDCATEFGSEDCSEVRPPGQLSCDELHGLYECADYCAAFCTRASGCGPFDGPLCRAGCAEDPVTCNAKSVAARSCDQLKPEARLYEDRARAARDGDVFISGAASSSAFGLCMNAAQCDAPLGCSSDTNTCSPCSADAECSHALLSKLYRCTTGQRCVEVDCLADKDCPGRVCNLETNTCVECRGNADCGASVFSRVCKDSECVMCTLDEHCDQGFSKCNTDTNQCVECLSNADCPEESFPRCGASHFCEGCRSDADCAGRATPFCDTSTCVICTLDAQCTDPAFPFCAFLGCSASRY